MSNEKIEFNDADIDQQASTKPITPVTPDAHIDLSPGAILLDRYKVIGLLGRGGMGSVYSVEHLNLQKSYAMKFLHKHQANDAAWRRFETEARAANKLDHPNLVKVHDSGLLTDGQPYFIMDLVEGESLAEILKTSGRLPLDRALKIFIQVGFALSYAHSNGVIHRDIKPSNIMISSAESGDAQGVLVKVVDFGIAKLTGKDEFNQQTLTKTGEIFGSPLYMSPEQCLGTSIDQRCDLYSLGCVIFEALTGAPPLVGESALATMMKHQSEAPLSLREASMGIEFPEKMETIVMQLLAKAPEQRYQSAQHLTADLIGLDSGQASMFEALPMRKPEFAQEQNYNSYLLLIGALCVFVGGCYTGAVMPRLPETETKPTKLTPSGILDAVDPLKAVPKVEAKEKTADKAQIEKLVHEKGFFSKPGTEPEERIFQFPDFAIGNIVFSKRNMPPAQGLMRFRNFTGLVFAPSEQFQKHPRLFQKFRSDDIASLDFQSRAHFMNLSEKDVTAANTALYAISHLKTVHTVDLGDTVLTTDGLLQLNGLPNLRKLLLTRINLSGTDIVKLNFLERLTLLKLVRVKNVKSVVDRLRRSKHLVNLCLSGCDIEPEDLKKIGEIKQLKTIELADNEKLTDDSIAFLPSQLTTVDLRNCSLTSKCSKHLLRLKQLSYVALSGKGWSEVDMAILKSHIPKATFFDGKIEI